MHRRRRAFLARAVRTLFINYSADARCVALNVRAGCRIRAVAGGMEPWRSVWRVSVALSRHRRALCVMRESRGLHAREHLPTYARPVFVVHHSIWPRAQRILRGGGLLRETSNRSGVPAYPAQTIQVSLWLPRPLWLCAYFLRRRCWPHREHSPGDRWKR